MITKTYISNEESVIHIAEARKEILKYLFIGIPFQILLIFFTYFSFDGPIGWAITLVLFGLLLLGIFGGVLRRGKFITSIIRTITVDEKDLLLETYDFLFFKGKEIKLDIKEVKGETNLFLYRELGGVYLVKNSLRKFILAKKFFDEYDEIINQLDPPSSLNHSN